jgi:CheY-like chemotaxis protein
MFKILVADDQKNDREKVAAKLSKNEQWEVETAKSAATAISMIEQKTYDLIVTEMKMESDESGISILKFIKKKDETVPVIIFTAYATLDSAVSSMKKGVSEYIDKKGTEKPYDTLYYQIKNILKKDKKSIATAPFVLPAGSSDFKKIITERYYYIDKTILVKDIINEGEVLLITRPRRFGKTLNMDMLNCFFDICNKEENKKLFNNLAISKEKECMELQGAFPVIYLTFKDVKKNDWKISFDTTILAISEAFEKYNHIKETLPDHQKVQFDKFINRSASLAEYSSSMKLLTKYLYNYYKKYVILLIDEYDTPILSARKYGYYDEAINFFRSFLGEALKDNRYLKKGVLTGILRIAKESIFSDLNNLTVFSLTDSRISDKFGFTEKEIDHTLAHFGIPEKKEEVKEWYDGYSIDDEKLYNPFSIIAYLKDKKPKNYWINTSSNDLIYELVADSQTTVKENFEKLIAGGYVEAHVTENVVFSSILGKSYDAIWTILFFSGYLTIGETLNEHLQRYRLRIPNKEVTLCFKENISLWLNNAIGSEKLNAMLKALISGEIEKFGELLQYFVKTILSYYDTIDDEPERVYQALLLGMLTTLENEYEIRSNRESGFGRYDIMLAPKEKDKIGIIMELKKIKDKESPEDVLSDAMAQIEQSEYITELTDKNVRQILGIGIAMKGKKIAIKSEEFSGCQNVLS